MILESKMTGEELFNKFLENKEKLDEFVDNTILRNASKIIRNLRKKKWEPVKIKTRSILIGDIRYYATITVWRDKLTKDIRLNQLFYSISTDSVGKKIIIQYVYRDLDTDFDTNHGDYDVVNLYFLDFIYIYENHLINRYRERYLGLKPEDISFEEVCEKFMSGKENEAAIIKFIPHTVKNKRKELEIRRKDGVYFGVMNEEDPMKIRWITYITSEMATREGQEFIREKAGKKLENVFETMKELSLLA